jgi:DNA replication protein DnaC
MADLVADLKRLRLYGMATCYAEGLEQGQPLMTTATALLAQLVQAEATDRATRSIRYQMHVARFPVHRDLAGFDFDQTKVDRRQITGFATTTFTAQAENLVLIGGTGTGKTQVSIAREADAEWQDDEDREVLASTK